MKPRIVGKRETFEESISPLYGQFFEKFNLEDKLEVTFKGHLEVANTEASGFYQANITPGQQESLAGTLKQYKFVLSPQKDIILTLNLEKDYNLIVLLSSCEKIKHYIP